jgi:hypothetical protein
MMPSRTPIGLFERYVSIKIDGTIAWQLIELLRLEIFVSWPRKYDKECVLGYVWPKHADTSFGTGFSIDKIYKFRMAQSILIVEFQV